MDTRAVWRDLITNPERLVKPVGPGVQRLVSERPEAVIIAYRDEKFPCPYCTNRSDEEIRGCIYCLGSGKKLVGKVVTAFSSPPTITRALSVTRQRSFRGVSEIGEGFAGAYPFVFPPTVKVRPRDYIAVPEWDCSGFQAVDMGIPRSIRAVMEVTNVFDMEDFCEDQGYVVLSVGLRSFLMPVNKSLELWFNYLFGRRRR